MPDFRLGKLNGQFVVVWYANGRRIRRRLGTRNAAEARRALAELIREQERIKRPADRLTVADIWADYVAEKEADGKVSADRMRAAWKALSPTFSGITAGQVSAALVRDYMARRRKQVSDGTIHLELGYLRAALRHAVRSGLLAVAPPVTLPAKPRPRTRHLTPEEARRLIDAARMPHVRLFILLALHTAGRPGALLGLTWDRVDFHRRRINLDDPSRERTAKGRAMVPLAEQLLPPLLGAREAALSPYVIEWAGMQVRSIKKAIRRAAERAGLDGVTPYVLRHTAAVWMAEAGIPMEEIAQYMGHTSPAVTFRTYARYSPDYLRKASDAISTVLSGQLEPRAVNGDGTKRD